MDIAGTLVMLLLPFAGFTDETVFSMGAGWR